MIRPCQCMFRKGRSLSLWLHFRLHFGVVLGAQFLTILLFGRPGCRNRAKRRRYNCSEEKSEPVNPSEDWERGGGGWPSLKTLQKTLLRSYPRGYKNREERRKGEIPQRVLAGSNKGHEEQLDTPCAEARWRIYIYIYIHMYTVYCKLYTVHCILYTA